MGFFNLFKPRFDPPAVRCIKCSAQNKISKIQFDYILQMVCEPDLKDLCPLIGKCKMCDGFIIPIDSTFKDPKLWRHFLFHEIETKIAKLTQKNDGRLKILMDNFKSDPFLRKH